MLANIVLVAGARPNFIKIAPLLKALRRRPGLKTKLVHTGQHYDFKMSEVFFGDLGIPKPHVHLRAGSGSHAGQTAAVMTAFERFLTAERPDCVVVVGDVNSTLACALAAVKMQIPVAHVEAGLRSFDRSMPEEINRIVTDRLSDLLFVTESSGLQNLRREGVKSQKIFFVGNIMIDSLLSNLRVIERSAIVKRLGLRKPYGVVTLHRPSNVDSRKAIGEIFNIFQAVSRESALVYPVHPRTKSRMQAHGWWTKFKKEKRLTLIEPLGYRDFIKLVGESAFVLTDSGGIQEETTMLGVPCLTMRRNTERPVTIREGTNALVGRDAGKILKSVKLILKGRWKKGRRPQLWDGRAAWRIAGILSRFLITRHENR